MKRLLVVLLGLILLPACGTTGSGNLVTEERDVGDFDSIEVSGGIDLRLTVDPDSSSTVSVTYDDNIIDRIRTEVDGGRLRIGSEGVTESISGEASGGADLIVQGDPPLQNIDVSGGADVGNR